MEMHHLLKLKLESLHFESQSFPDNLTVDSEVIVPRSKALLFESHCTRILLCNRFSFLELRIYINGLNTE